MRSRVSIWIALWSVAWVAAAQDTATAPPNPPTSPVTPTPTVPAAPPDAPYEGVSPLNTNEPPFPERVGQARVLTWPGFERNADGCFRVFFQLSDPGPWSSEKTETGLAITFKNTKTHLRNTTRPLDMSYFDAPVTMVAVKRKHKDVVAEIILRDPTQMPRLRTISQEETGYHFLLAEFKCAENMAAPIVKKSNADK